MLTAPQPRTTSPASWRTLGRAAIPSTRGLPLPTVGAVLAGASVPTLVTVVDGGGASTGALVAAVVIAAPCAAFWVEDPAAETLSASPTSLTRRRVLRLAALAFAALAALAATVAVAVTANVVPTDDLVRRAAELTAVSGLAAAASGLGDRRGVASSGPIGAVAGALVALVLSSLSYRFEGLPPLVEGAEHERWWVVAAAAWTVAAWTARDPMRR